MAGKHRRLGELLIEKKLIQETDLELAIAEQKRTGQLLGATLISLRLLDERQLVDLLHEQLALPLVDLEQITLDESLLQYVSEDLARKYGALPVEVEGRSTLVVAMTDPMNVAALDDLRFQSGMFIKPVLAMPTQMAEAIERYYQMDTSMNEVIQNIIESESTDLEVREVAEEEQKDAIDDLMKEAEGRPIVRLTNWLLHSAVEERASDIHIEPQERDVIVRFRVDGMLREIQRLPKWTQGAVVSRIKVLSSLDIAEKRQPQDGRLVVEIGNRRVDMRVSTLPVTNGEKVVIRVTDQRRLQVSLNDLGMAPEELDAHRGALERPQGLILVTGPTGSGKSTLLYSSLRFIQNVTKNIVTVEDPVELQVPGINQVQVDDKAKKTFPAALRAILRQDPDVIMIGEIRDRETAQIAFRASATGHLVLSTIHTNDAASAVTRLVDLGLEPFMVASSLVSVVSMRLVRTLCPRCKEAYEAPASDLHGAVAGDGPVSVFRAKGCPHCSNTGFHGRTGIFELLGVDDAIRQLVIANAPDSSIRRAAIEGGMRTLSRDGLRKVLDGLTSIDEVGRVVYLGSQAARLCSECRTVLGQEHDYCPSCGHFSGDHCRHCSRRLQPGWKFCAFCGEDTAVESPEERRRARERGRPRPLRIDARLRRAS